MPIGSILYNQANLLAVRYMVRGDNTADKWRQVLYLYQRASSDHTLQNLPYLKGYVHYTLGEYDQAFDDWAKFPDADYWFTMRGKIALVRGDATSALKFLRIATSLTPNSSTAYYYGGLALYRLERYDEALQWLYTALDLNNYDERFAKDRNVGDVWWPAAPENLVYGASPAMTHVYISAIYYRLRQWEAMRDAAQSAVEANPQLSLGYLQLGTAHFMYGELTGDMEDYRLADETFSFVADVVSDTTFPYYIYKARVCWKLGDISNASISYANVARVSRFVNNHREVIQFFAETAQVETLTSLYDDMLMQTPRKPQYGYRWIMAAEAYLAVGKPERACELLDLGLGMCDDETCGLASGAYVLADSPLMSVCR